MANTVNCDLHIEINCECPYCEETLNLLDPDDTAGIDLNEGGSILSQAIPDDGSHWCEHAEKLKVETVICGKCGNVFEVNGCVW